MHPRGLHGRRLAALGPHFLEDLLRRDQVVRELLQSNGTVNAEPSVAVADIGSDGLSYW